MAYTSDELQIIMREHILRVQLLSENTAATSFTPQTTSNNEPLYCKKAKKLSKLRSKLMHFFGKFLHLRRKTKLLKSNTNKMGTVISNTSTSGELDKVFPNGYFNKSKKLPMLLRHAAIGNGKPNDAPLSAMQLLPRNGIKFKATTTVSFPNVVCHAAILQLLQYQLANMAVWRTIRTLRNSQILYCPKVNPQTKVNILRATYTSSSWQKLKPLLYISYQMPAQQSDWRIDNSVEAWDSGEACCSTTFNTITATQYVKELDGNQGVENEIIELLHHMIETQPNNDRQQEIQDEAATPKDQASTNGNKVQKHSAERKIRILLLPIPDIYCISSIKRKEHTPPET